jgi:hypothetical protein
MAHHPIMSVTGRLNRASGTFAEAPRVGRRKDSVAPSADWRDEAADAVPLYLDMTERVSGFLGGTPMRVLLAASAAGLAIGAFLTDYQ